MSTRPRTRRAAATSHITEEAVTTVETRPKRTRAPRKSAPPKVTSKTPTRSDAAASTPAPATASKRRLRSTTEAASPLRALEEQPAKKARTTSRKTPAPAPTRPQPTEEEDDGEAGIFFSKSEPCLSYFTHTKTLIRSPLPGFDVIALQLRNSQLEARIVELEATCSDQSTEISQLCAQIAQLEEEKRDLVYYSTPKTRKITANMSNPEFDSFNVDQSEPQVLVGDEAAIALLRHVQEAAKAPQPTTPPRAIDSDNMYTAASPTPNSATTIASEKPSTPSRSLFGSFTSPFTAIKNLFTSSTPQLQSPTPSRPPPADTITEVLSMPPTPVGVKRPGRRVKKPNRLVKALLRGVDENDAAKAATWAEQIAADLRNDSTAGEKRKRLQMPVLFRDLKHLPSSKPWESGFSLPDDVLDLEDDDVVPAWAVYTSIVEEEERQVKKTKKIHTTSVEEDMPASINEVFSASTTSHLDFQPRRSIDPSPMFDIPLHHQEGGNVFNELRGHDATLSDRENLQRELKAGNSQRQNEVESHPSDTTKGFQKVHDPSHGSFSVPDSESEDEDEEVRAQPVWTQAPPPAPTPSHVTLPSAGQSEEVERQRQKLMKHTPHKPSRLQQVSYPSPSLLSDAGNDSILAASPLKFSELFGEIPDFEPLVFGDPELDAAVAAIGTSEALQAKLTTMNWSVPTVTYDSDEEELSPV